MLIWIIALHCEAKPVIDYYRLKKSAYHRGFDLFHNGDMQCVISGIGKNNAAAATAWVAALNQDAGSTCWINLGVAGGGGRAIGEICVLDKITDSLTGRSYYPAPVIDSRLATAGCVSLDIPSNDYQPQCLFDMEVSAFFATATRFSSTEQVHSLKVISDNEDHPPVTDKAMISELINAQRDSIDDYARLLMQLSI